MALWKYWYDTRVKILAFFGIILCLQLLFVGLVGSIDTLRPIRPDDAPELLQTSFRIPALLLLFFGWVLGKEGAVIGKLRRDFPMTSESSRGRLVWNGWLVGMVEGVALWVTLSVIAYGAMLLKLHRLGIPVLDAPQWNISPGRVLFLFAIFLFNLGLIYGLAYCIGAITRSGSWALIGSALVVVGYGILRSVLPYLPDFLLPSIIQHHNRIEVPSTLAFAVHACLLVAFPAVAHFALERMDT